MDVDNLRINEMPCHSVNDATHLCCSAGRKLKYTTVALPNDPVMIHVDKNPVAIIASTGLTVLVTSNNGQREMASDRNERQSLSEKVGWRGETR